MSTEKKDLTSSLSQSFEIDIVNRLNEARKQLKARIQELLDTDMERLLSILYRIDVSQEVTDQIFSAASKEDMAGMLADAVIKRQAEKIKTRNQYKGPVC